MLKNNEIVKKMMLAGDTVSFLVYSPIIALKAKAGQFVVVRICIEGERIPLTIADSDPQKGLINLVVLKRGKTTNQMAELSDGDIIIDIAGPLGKNSEIENFGTVVIIGGGVGIAPIFPIIKAMGKAGNFVISIIGAKNEETLIFEEEIKAHSNEFYICTDDGSKGYKGFVSNFLTDYISKKSSNQINRVVAIGPVPMMEAVCKVTKPMGIKTIVSLNPIMVDGTGMCGSCRVEVAGKTLFGCVDGPEFDGHLVDFNLLNSRLNIYCKEESKSLENYGDKHKCKMNK